MDETEPPAKKARKTTKSADTLENFVIPTIQTFNKMATAKYSLPELKSICVFYKLKVTGTKKVLYDRIYDFLQSSFHIIKIQKVVRGFLQRLIFKLQGPAFRKRKICVNDSDFVTMEPLNEIAYDQFISFEDVDKFIYGFDIVSLYNMFKEDRLSNKKYSNPYNRTPFQTQFLQTCKRIILLNIALKHPLNLAIDNEDANQTIQQQIDMRGLQLFQIINSYGHYSDSKWLLNLERPSMARFVLGLMEFWNYRSNLPSALKRQICPPDGNPFRNVNILQITDMNELKRITLNLVERFVCSAESIDHRNLGAFYVLGSLTQVSESAATAMPWLRDSFI